MEMRSNRSYHLQVIDTEFFLLPHVGSPRACWRGVSLADTAVEPVLIMRLRYENYLAKKTLDTRSKRNVSLSTFSRHTKRRGKTYQHRVWPGDWQAYGKECI